MSLRDQLLKAGLANKKDARRVDLEKKQKQKAEQGQREKARVLAEKQAREAAEQAEQAERERLLTRKQREQERSEVERALQIRQIITANRMGARGTTRFYFKDLDGKRVHRLMLPEAIAFKLRCGMLAIAALPGPEPTYHIVNKRAADRLADLAPELLVFRVLDTKGISRPEEDFLHQQWEPSLRPHRVTNS